MPQAELTCRELVEWVTDYFENGLPDETRARVEQHLASCDGCEGYVAQMRETIITLGGLNAQDLSLGAQEQLLDLFRAWRTR